MILQHWEEAVQYFVVVLAAALKRCMSNFFEAGCVYGRPRIVKNARKLDEITYDEMLELAKPLQMYNRSVELLKR